ncbi:MAG UNVERIFIED_CONTAM: hypothetical protein LVQ98_05900 [Rickettsiaceae bacterium]
MSILPSQKISIFLLLILALFAFMWYYISYITNSDSRVMYHLENVSHETYITIQRE